MNPRVCILTSGKGTRMGEYSNYINKALLPYKKKALISHLIESFPAETEFVISVGYQKQQVQDYLQCAHPDGKFIYSLVDNFDREGSGPGYSLLQCQAHLKAPFYFLPCDTLSLGPLPTTHNKSWVGVAKVSEEESKQYCNFQIQNDRVVEIYDKELVSGPSFYSFSGLLFVHEPEIFWSGLSVKNLIHAEHQVSNGLKALLKENKLFMEPIEWLDLGNLENYRSAVSKSENYDFSKTDEFIYFQSDKVIKFFKNKEVSERRTAKAQLNPHVFPNIECLAGQFYSYRLQPGKTFYQCGTLELFSQLLYWLSENLWTAAKPDWAVFQKACRDFYFEKTTERIQKYLKKYPQVDAEAQINNQKVDNIELLLERVPWKTICNGKPTFFHGDLQFDNILYDKESKVFTLIDWRQDFGGHVAWGDQYYDLAKLYGGILLNYDLIKLNLIEYQEQDSKIFYDFAQRNSKEEYICILKNFIESQQLDFKKVKILTALIYLNMSPLHHYPFDKLLWAMGKQKLQNELNSDD